MYYDMDTKPILDCMEWAKYLEGLRVSGEKTLAYDIIGNYRVSTIYVGLDMGFMHVGPLIFETMIFCEEGTKDTLGIDMWQDRYRWKAQALEGHQYALKLARGEISVEGKDD